MSDLAAELSRPPQRVTAVAAALAGVPIAVAFFTWHWFFIQPVWDVFIEAVVSFPIAVLGITWSWRVARQAGGFEGAWGGLQFGALFAAGVAISEILALARGRGAPMTLFDVIELLYAALPVPLIALAGIWLGRSRTAAVAFAVAALLLNLHLGGVVMHLGGTDRAFVLFAVLLSAYLACGLILHGTERMIARVVPQ